MSTASKLGVKLILEDLLDSENIGLRRKALAFVLEFFSLNNLDDSKAEAAIESEVKADFKHSNLWIKRMIADLEE